jgi:PAS domain S-box-containing protein/putative nucleotidyltransferase with HDIG domain
MDTFTKIVLNTIDDIIVLVDGDMTIVKVNKRGLNLLGYSDQELNRKPISTIITAECAGHLRLSEKNKHEHSKPVPATLHGKTGTDIPVLLSMSVVYGKNGTCHGAVLKMCNPGDENSQMTQYAEKEYRQLVEKAGLAIVIDNRDGELTFYNKSCLDLFGYTAEEMKEQSLQTLLHPDDLQRVMEYHHSRFADNQAPSRYECKAIRKDGSTMFLEVDVVKLVKNGTVFGTLSCIWEITKRKRVEEELHQHRKNLEELVAERTHALTQINDQLRNEIKERTHIEEQLQKSLAQSRNILEQTVRALSSTIGMRDPYTADHQERVTRLACAIADMMDLPDGTINDIRLAGMLHDIGKIAVPVEILSKPTELTETEYSLIKTHPQVGYEILQHIDFPRSVAQIVQEHHERIDGSGYPQGLRNGEILFESRILAVADVVEAMSAHRPNRPGQSIEQTLDYLDGKKGSLFDPPVVECCIRVFQKKGFSFHR